LSRRALARAAAGCCLGAGGYAALVEPRWLEVSEHRVVLGRKTVLEGYRVAQLSDLHLSKLGALHQRVIEELGSRAPQLVVLSGDVIEDRSALPVLRELCSALVAPGREVVATLGNWEHWGEVPVAELAAVYADAGVTFLCNQATRLESGVVLVGTDDACSGYADLAASFRDLPAGDLRLLATHAPGILDELPAEAARIDVALAGHTHGGQVTFLGAAPWVPPGSGRFVSGMYRLAAGQAYVSRGIGTSLLTLRFGARPELPFFTIAAG
jgi:predicted MPP superfamily phosphohydrolase